MILLTKQVGNQSTKTKPPPHLSYKGAHHSPLSSWELEDLDEDISLSGDEWDELGGDINTNDGDDSPQMSVQPVKTYHCYTDFDEVMDQFRKGHPLSCAVAESNGVVDGKPSFSIRVYVATQRGFLGIVLQQSAVLAVEGDTYWQLQLDPEEEQKRLKFTDYCVFLPERRITVDNVRKMWQRYVAVAMSWRSLTMGKHGENALKPIFS